MNRDAPPEWMAAFEGIDFKPQAGTARSFIDVVGPRLRRRVDTECVRVPIATLYDIAQRIDALSRSLLEAQAERQGGITSLDADALAAHEKAQQEAAERAAAKMGVLIEDGEGDWAALYNNAGRLVEQGHISNIRHTALDDSWSVTRIDGDGLLFDWDSGAAPTDDDWQEFPDNLGAVQRRLAMKLREATA